MQKIANKRRICAYCKKKRIAAYMISIGTKDGSYFQKGKTIELFVCDNITCKSIAQLHTAFQPANVANIDNSETHQNLNHENNV